MKTIIRRLRRLEGRFCPPVETEFSRRLQERIEAARRRLAESDFPGSGPRTAGDREHEDVRINARRVPNSNPAPERTHSWEDHQSGDPVLNELSP